MKFRNVFVVKSLILFFFSETVTIITDKYPKSDRLETHQIEIIDIFLIKF